MKARKERVGAEENSWNLGNVSRLKRRGCGGGGWYWGSESGEVVTRDIHTMPEQWEELRIWKNTIRFILEFL